MSKPSELLSDRFSVVLSDDVVEWYDEGIWKHSGTGARFDFPIPPEDFRAARFSPVSGGLMLPDTLPIVGDGCGNVLALRFGFAGELTDVVEWNHEGGSWHPCGGNLVEAILYDAARTFLEERETGESVWEESDTPAFLEWAFSRHRISRGAWGSVREFLQSLGPDRRSIAELLPERISQIAVQRDAAREALVSGLDKACSQHGGMMLAKSVGATWQQFQQWILDPPSMPESIQTKISKRTGVPVADLIKQDFDSALRAAQSALDIRTDLAWPYAVAGWAAEKQGDQTGAIAHYFKGLRCLDSSADFTQYWTDFERPRLKFTASRLRSFQDHLEDGVLTDPYFQACVAPYDPSVVPLPERQFWMDQARTCESSGDHRGAYQAYYAAGWDYLVFDDMPHILECLAESARRAGSDALAAIAQHHLDCLNYLERYETSPQPARVKKPWWKFW